MPAGLADIRAAHFTARGLTAADGERLVFEAPEGGPVRYANWRGRSWLPAIRAVGCPTAGFHDLRRAAATVLVTGGVDVRTAQARLGHSDPRITLAVYAQVVAEADRRAADTAGAAFLSTLATRSAPQVAAPAWKAVAVAGHRRTRDTRAMAARPLSLRQKRRGEYPG